MTEQHPDHPAEQSPEQAGQHPEYLESDAGRPADKEPRARRGLAIGGGLAALVLVGGGAAAAWWWTSDGGEAAEALPGDALVYVGMTLDPSGSQKVEAVRTLQKFPDLAAELGMDGDAGEVDPKAAIVEAIIAEAGCEDTLSYADDVEPWLGDRAGVVLRGELSEDTVPLLAVEVTDESLVDAGLEALATCDGGEEPDDLGAYEVRDGWLYATETQEGLDDAFAALDEGSLADDADYAELSGLAGDTGIVSAYVAPALGSALGDLIASQSGLDEMGDSAQLAEGLAQMEGFGGAVAQVRFEDGALEVEAGGMASDEAAAVTDVTAGGDMVSSLPAETDAVLAAGLADGAIEAQVEALSSSLGTTPDEIDAELQSSFNLTLDQLSAAVGDGIGIALGSGLDLNSAMASTSLDALPVAVLVGGTPDDVAPVVDTLNILAGYALGSGEITVEETPSGSALVTGNAYGDAVASGGDLASDPVFSRAVPDADGAGSVFFLRMAGSDLFADIAEQSGTTGLDALEAVGASVSGGDGEFSMRLRITTTD
ncbi:DUF3352 domain-containing protein [Nocardioides bruguierae]|uniref:DUF3352 domain-containing protein n=1 Tax=Nocardioides bruguierae TaxID=2945102 RepID=UPI002021353C|nr:DUF3352 domain-containing protein [Nocardioides bruguierae]MCL8027582.1 DUF3352 domain-containing protein [Nocardioides bruguierae]